jgi:hypothetical protein
LGVCICTGSTASEMLYKNCICYYLTLTYVYLLQIEVKLEDIANNNSQLGDLRQQLASLIQECEHLYSVYEERRNKVSIVIVHFISWYSGSFILSASLKGNVI